jgi:hypothetical protein
MIKKFLLTIDAEILPKGKNTAMDQRNEMEEATNQSINAFQPCYRLSHARVQIQ